MSRGKLLIVEDEFVVAENLRIDLELMGYEVAGMASSGEEAMMLARRDNPDLALMDIKLPGGMDGIETAINLRQELDVPVIFITAFADESLLERAKAADPFGYLVKPYERKGLRAGVETAHYKARMEHLLRESESRFRSMFENSPVAYLSLDEFGRCLDFNSELCELVGYTGKELTLKSFAEFCVPEKRQLYIEQFAKLKDRKRFEIEVELVRGDKKLLVVLLDGGVQYDADGEFIRIHCILQNITERKRLGEALRSANETLEKRVEERTSELLEKTKHLDESNTALTVLLKRVEQERIETRESITRNIRDLVFPYLDQVEHGELSKEQLKACMHEIRNHLEEITSHTPLYMSNLGLSPSEMRIAEMIRMGKSNKEIADLLSVSDGTVRKHREHIRKKLGLTNKQSNLQTFLHSLR
jgi:PAS domain S-box-containing protein